MNRIDYDPRKFTKDAYGELIPREEPLGWAVRNGWPWWAGVSRLFNIRKRNSARRKTNKVQ